MFVTSIIYMHTKDSLNKCYNLFKKSRNIVKNTPLEYSNRLSKKYNCNLYLKREDQQIVRSFKIRGSYNKIYNNNNYDKITTASAGNHAQGVSYVSNILNKKCKIFLPTSTPRQKIDRIKFFGNDDLDVEILGDNVDESLEYSKEYSSKNNALFVHPFDDDDVIIGQSSIAHEIFQIQENIDYILVCVGGGGLVSGVCNYVKLFEKNTKIICAEPENANSLQLSLKNNNITSLEYLDKFVDGAAVKTVGTKNFDIVKNNINDIFSISKNEICYNLVDIYQNDGIVLEPAGILGICSLERIKHEINGKNVVCILSGGNNDILRYNEILERSLIYKDLKHYFLIDFNQRPGQLKEFVNKILLNNIDITRFEYLKKTNKEMGSVLIGVELNNKVQYDQFMENLEKYKYIYKKIDESSLIYNYLI
jgi:threonine dehydratase